MSDDTLVTLPAGVDRPSYDRRNVRIGVVHLGIGAFHRAHQAAIFDALLASGDLRWGIAAASLRSPSVRDAMVPQDHLYTLVERGAAGERLRVLGAIRDILVAPEDPKALVAAMAHPDVAIVTLTVTEKGYHLDPATGLLNCHDGAVAADLASLTAPRTAPGFIAAALAARRAAGIRSFTAISCDNLPRNSTRLRDAVLTIASAHDRALAEWIGENSAFPQTMVDRIVPATDDADVAHMADRLGVEDRAMVKTEPFLQWVIEDRFAGPRPAFEQFGVQVTPDVTPWETAKLRLLNGAHSGIAYLGGLAGIEHVHEFAAHPGGRRFVEALWNETRTTFAPPRDLDLDDYTRALMARFANPSLAHRTRQIATDGSQKLPQRLLAPIADRLAARLPIDMLGLAVAAWMRWQSGRDDAGTAFAVDDPLAPVTAAALAHTGSAAERVDALLAIDAIFPPALVGNPRLREALVPALDRLEREGARAVLARI